jgi:hypothetical protein
MKIWKRKSFAKQKSNPFFSKIKEKKSIINSEIEMNMCPKNCFNIVFFDFFNHKNKIMIWNLKYPILVISGQIFLVLFSF